MTDLALRAYRIADAYRQRGVKVVMGGIHPTVLPGEALQHADAVVIGEGDLVWPRILSDAVSGEIQRIYRPDRFAELQGMVKPRWDLYPKALHRGYTPIPVSVETARGCPYGCEFCSIGSVMGRQCRYRPVREVIAEIETIDSPYLFFVDDNLALNRYLAKEFFREMIPLHRSWAGQGGVSLAEDPGLLRLMKRSGCTGLLIGFESVETKTNSGLTKIRNLKIDFCRGHAPVPRGRVDDPGCLHFWLRPRGQRRLRANVRIHHEMPHGLCRTPDPYSLSRHPVI